MSSATGTFKNTPRSSHTHTEEGKGGIMEDGHTQRKGGRVMEDGQGMGGIMEGGHSLRIPTLLEQINKMVLSG